MAEQNKPFVITDRRRYTMDGEVRADAEPSQKPVREKVPEPAASEPAAGPVAVEAAPTPPEEQELDEAGLPQTPTQEQMEQAKLAYTQTADRLTTAIRAANPGMEHPPAMNFDGLVQSIYMSAIMQLGGATPEGQQPQVDLMGAQQSIEMLDVLKQRTQGNLLKEETALLDRALFELQMAFLEITQALARSAAAKQQQGFGAPAPGGRPSIVR